MRHEKAMPLFLKMKRQLTLPLPIGQAEMNFFRLKNALRKDKNRNKH